MSGFTKGPWAVGVADAESGEIEVISEARPYICLVLPGVIDGLTEANARLIAAAPELYERLKEARDAIASLPEYALGGEDILHPHDGEVLGHYPIRDELLSNINAALSKATRGAK